MDINQAFDPAGIINNLAASLIYEFTQMGAVWIRDKAFGTDQERAIESAWKTAFQSMLETFAGQVGDERDLQTLGYIVRDFIQAEGVAAQLLNIAIRDGEPDLPFLRRRFDELSQASDYDYAYFVQAVSLDFDNLMNALVDGLYDALKDTAEKPNSPLYNVVSLGQVENIKGQLRRMDKKLDSLDEKMDAVCAKLREVEEAIRNLEGLQGKGIFPEAQLEKSLSEQYALREQLQRQIGAAIHIEGGVHIQNGDFVLGNQTKSGDGGVAVGGQNNKVTINMPGMAGEADPKDLRTSYLNWVYKDCARLSLEGIDRKSATETGQRLLLSKVYTALLTLTPEEQERSEKSDLLQEHRGVRLRPALSLLNEHRHLALLGEPGSGKSTFVNFVALCMAGEMLGDKEANLQILTEPIPDNKDERRSDDEAPKRQPWNPGKLLPVRVVLRDFAARGLPKSGKQRVTANHLLDFIAAELQGCGLGDFYPILHKILIEQGGLLLLDGLDEVSYADHRRRQIQQAIEGFADTHPKCRVLVTCRTYAYQQQQWRLADFNEAVLAPFSKAQIAHFIDSWYQHIASQQRMHKEQARSWAEMLKRAIFNNERLLELAERPLLLTLMASLQAWRGGALPEKRQQLYEETVDLLLDLWESRKTAPGPDGKIEILQPSLTELLKVGKDSMKTLLQELAYEAHASQPDLRGTADIREVDLLGKLLDISRNPEIKANSVLLIDYLSERAGLLVQRGNRVYTFPHRSFQEYLAARYLADYPDRVASLVRQAPERWREVALLAGAKAASGSQYAIWGFVDELCSSELDDKEPSQEDIWGAHLAGQILAESGNLQNLSKHNQDQLERLRRWLVHIIQGDKLPALERVQAGDTLAVLGDPRFDPDYWYLPREPMLGFIEVPAGKFMMGDNRKDLWGEPVPSHQVKLDVYYIAKYPTTVAQFRVFVKDSGHKPGDKDSLRGIANHPVIWVSWEEAKEYCKWLNDKLSSIASERLGAAEDEAEHRFWELFASEKLVIDLPSEAEWEKAARGTDGRRYPWGEKADPNRANYDETGVGHTSTVGCFPSGMTPYGALDMAGNVWEWTRSIYKEYPYEADDGREDQSLDDSRVVRGGSWIYDDDYVRCASRYRGVAFGRNDNFGFRVRASSSRK